MLEGDGETDCRGLLVYDVGGHRAEENVGRGSDTAAYPNECLAFNSHFESGNLKQAFRTSNSTYTLVLSPDAGSQDFTQWYYFSAANHTPQEVTFRIVNFVKEQSLYTEGMRPLVRSKRRELNGGEAWQREGSNITYLRSTEIRRKLSDSGEPQYFYVLSFTYLFKFWHDTVYFAYSMPYTYTDLRNLVERIRSNEWVEVGTLCVTPAGTEVPRLTITSSVSTYRSSPTLPPHHLKKVIILTARVHPGESISSYVIQGAIEFLLSSNREAELLRTAFVFEIVPMLNPDGVKCGFYRCGPEGVDLNRAWSRPSKSSSTTVFHAKELIDKEREKKEVLFFVDIHGHSRKKNAFLYGCDSLAISHIERRRNVLTKTIPLLMQALEPCFSYNSCSFVVTRDKEHTARVVCHRELGILLSFTLENSFFSSRKVVGEQLSIEDYQRIGGNMCRTMLSFVQEKGLVQLFLSTAAALAKAKRSTEENSVNTSFSKSLSTVSFEEECSGVLLPLDSRGASLWSFESLLNLSRDAWDSLLRRYELAPEPEEVSSEVKKEPRRYLRRPTKLAATRLERVLEIAPKPQAPYCKLSPKPRPPKTPKVPVRMTTIELVNDGPTKVVIPLRDAKQRLEFVNRSSVLPVKTVSVEQVNTQSVITLKKHELVLPELHPPIIQRHEVPPKLVMPEERLSEARSRSTRPDVRNYWDLLLDHERIDPLGYLSHTQESLVSVPPVRDYNSLLPGINTSRVAERPIDLAKLMAESTRLRVRKELAMKNRGKA